ncbi:unnamed protein product [Agarophyton chilense]
MGFMEAYLEPVLGHPTAATVLAPLTPKKVKTVDTGFQTKRAGVEDEIGVLQAACLPIGGTSPANVAPGLGFSGVWLCLVVVLEAVEAPIPSWAALRWVDVNGAARKNLDHLHAAETQTVFRITGLWDTTVRFVESGRSFNLRASVLEVAPQPIEAQPGVDI